MFALALIAQAVIKSPQETAPAPTPVSLATPHWVRGQPVQLMVLREVNSRQVKPGDLFKLRVNAPVIIDGIVAVPIGAFAWGEVLAVSGTGVAGQRGRVSFRLLRLDTPTGPLALTGTTGTEGKANTAGVVIGILSFGIGGLLMKGGNAVLKAGDLITGYVDEGAAPTPGPSPIPR